MATQGPCFVSQEGPTVAGALVDKYELLRFVLRTYFEAIFYSRGFAAFPRLLRDLGLVR